MARRFGVRTPDVILLPIGGVARLERIPEAPRQELLVALAGPGRDRRDHRGPVPGRAGDRRARLRHPRRRRRDRAGDLLGEPFPTQVPFLVHLLVVNATVLGFNLIPAFPLDGGRVFRALLARSMGLARATRIAGMVGQMFALGLGVLGFVWSQPIMLLVAFFIFLGAGSEASAVATRLAGQGLERLAHDGDRLPDHSGPCFAAAGGRPAAGGRTARVSGGRQPGADGGHPDPGQSHPGPEPAGPGRDRRRSDDLGGTRRCRRRSGSRTRSTGFAPAGCPRCPWWTPAARSWGCSPGTTSPTCCW